jgi:Kef-type K+ transport system membrane component KefB
VIAFLLNSRGFVELVIATIAYQAGLIDLALFSIVVGIGVITTIMSPITARIAISRQLKQQQRLEDVEEARERMIAPPVA